MSAAAFFDAARELKRELTGEGLSQAEVDALNAIIAGWVPSDIKNPTALSDAGAFFDAIRKTMGPFLQSQIEGFQALLQAFGVARWPLSWTAYGLATAWHETAAKMEPVEEAFYLLAKADSYRKGLRYYPWFGRGYVQITWEKNYRDADEALGLNGALIANPDLALKPDIAARIIVWGMEAGAFTGKGLKDYLPLSGRAGFDAYTQARRIINGQDKAQTIAKEAQQFEAALEAGGWR
jgi:putative chitinase